MRENKWGGDGENCNRSKYNIYIMKMSSGDTLFTQLIYTNKKVKNEKSPYVYLIDLNVAKSL